MCGGSSEYTMSNYNNLAGSSKITPSNLADKYIDRYPTTSSGYTSTMYGDVVYETSGGAYIDGSGSTLASWYGDFSSMPGTSYPWFIRGANHGSGSGAGLFSFDRGDGGLGANSWRVVVLVKAGL